MILQATEMFAELVSSSAPQLVAFAIGAVAGALVPTYYAQERLRGFGRAMFSRVPYEPPPGMQREQAMQAATDEVDVGETDGNPGGSGSESGEEAATDGGEPPDEGENASK